MNENDKTNFIVLVHCSVFFNFDRSRKKFFIVLKNFSIVLVKKISFSFIKKKLSFSFIAEYRWL